MYRKAKDKEAKLGFMGYLLTENRNGLIVQARVSQATGTAAREVSLAMLDAASGFEQANLAQTRITIPRSLLRAAVNAK